ncbi:hypothetical protein VKT23_017553 [Stygiomarasmius scandens]|uniref:Uncharacterized protein n=1 Tax=Marasmiellus scandens TaxID=2682957 RepID=A0ABR1IVN9_9AGAR
MDESRAFFAWSVWLYEKKALICAMERVLGQSISSVEASFIVECSCNGKNKKGKSLRHSRNRRLSSLLQSHLRSRNPYPASETQSTLRLVDMPFTLRTPRTHWLARPHAPNFYVVARGFLERNHFARVLFNRTLFPNRLCLCPQCVLDRSTETFGSGGSSSSGGDIVPSVSDVFATSSLNCETQVVPTKLLHRIAVGQNTKAPRKLSQVAMPNLPR